MSELAINGGAPVREKPWPRWPTWDESERRRLDQVLESGEWGGFNQLVDEFEAAFAQRHQTSHCVAAANGTLTLEAALRVFGIGPGDEVIVPPYTFIATANAVRMAGAVPVFVDVEPDTYNIDPSRVREAITPETKALIPVHFAGQIADMDALMELANEYGLAVIEDAAHAHGAVWGDASAGSIGHVGSFSLQQSKNLTAGEGGILLTNDDLTAEKLWSFVNQGRLPGGKWYEHGDLGSNLRMTGWQAGILLAQLERLDEQIARRMVCARRLIDGLAEFDGLEPMRWDERCATHSFHLFMMRYDPKGFHQLPRDRFVEALNAEGVPCSTGYAMPLYRQPPLDARYSRIMECPISERACKEAIWLTQNLLLAEPEEMDDILAAVAKVREYADELI